MIFVTEFDAGSHGRATASVQRCAFTPQPRPLRSFCRASYCETQDMGAFGAMPALLEGWSG